MDGVINFDFSHVTARKLINLDAAEVGTVIAGCAGGMRCRMCFALEREANENGAVTVKIGGLAGGHSGENIKEGRGNANKLMGRFLSRLGEFALVSINGGGKTNAIHYFISVTLKVWLFSFRILRRTPCIKIIFYRSVSYE